ncbi:hypothetical protein VaNZ11_010758 [Volvox africanus]|uniref:Pherophorin domain-containing protein n=1 Tax=Volvox africanus TaxID=51714 RepID=A0ABQ5SB57_9CHLO|nr:hypothetical protein VaNZ11_010758 [Volvox africanus]
MGWNIYSVFLISACLLAATPGSHASGSSRALLADTDFPPRCSCIRTARAGPFVLNSPSSSGSTNIQRYCFKIQASQYCDPKFTCCNDNQGINKIEFDVVPDCKGSIQKVTVNGRNFASYEFNAPLGVLRITKLGLDATAAPGTEICIFLQKSSVCPSLTSFCAAGNGICKYAIFNLDFDDGTMSSKCCPVNLVGPVPLSPPPFPPFANATARPPPSAPLPPSLPPPSPPPPSPLPPSPPPPSPSPPPPSPPPPSPSPPPPSPPPPSPSPPSPLPPPPSPPPPSPPSPPPPPPRSSFPNCSCIREPRSSQVFVYPNVVTSPAKERGFTQLCFTVGTLDVCTSRSRCCQFELYKAEFEADAACVGSLSYITVDGAKRSRFFQLTPYPAIKVININKSFEDAEGTEICLIVKTADCGSLTKLGAFHDGSITVSLFNKPSATDVNCCPISTVF